MIRDFPFTYLDFGDHSFDEISINSINNLFIFGKYRYQRLHHIFLRSNVILEVFKVLKKNQLVRLVTLTKLM